MLKKLFVTLAAAAAVSVPLAGVALAGPLNLDQADHNTVSVLAGGGFRGG